MLVKGITTRVSRLNLWVKLNTLILSKESWEGSIFDQSIFDQIYPHFQARRATTLLLDSDFLICVELIILV